MAQHAGQNVHVELLIRPVKLRTQRDVIRVFQVRKDGLNGGLAPVALDDLGCGPGVPICCEHQAAKSLLRQPVQIGLAELVGQRELRVVSQELKSKHVLQVLTTLETVLDVSLDSGAAASLLATFQSISQRGQPAPCRFNMLENATDLSLS